MASKIVESESQLGPGEGVVELVRAYPDGSVWDSLVIIRHGRYPRGKPWAEAASIFGRYIDPEA